MTSTAAPAYQVPPRKVVAVEHPMVIKNLDNGLKTFGTNRPFQRVSSFLLTLPTGIVPNYRAGLVISLVTQREIYHLSLSLSATDAMVLSIWC